MISNNFLLKPLWILALTSLGLIFGVNVHADARKRCRVLIADRVFDGVDLHKNAAVLIKGKTIRKVGTADQFRRVCRRHFDLGNATILPGIIESHAHVTFQNVPLDKVLRHGVTTVRDVGGPLLAPAGGKGSVRLLGAGPIIQAEGGYPLNIFASHGDHNDHHAAKIIAVVATTEQEAIEHVKHLAAKGVNVIKIALEPGGEHGAPWSGGHGHAGPASAEPWPILSEDITRAIVETAHAHDLRVTAHVGEEMGAARSLAAGVDEWAHVPCGEVSDETLQLAASQVKVVTTLDTLGACQHISANAQKLAHYGAEFLYGSEIGHNNVPWGANGEELHRLLMATSGHDGVDFEEVLDVFRSATSKAGENIGIPGLGTLSPGAPADVIAVRGNAFEKFKLLEYPDLVISGGRMVVNNFKTMHKAH